MPDRFFSTLVALLLTLSSAQAQEAARLAMPQVDPGPVRFAQVAALEGPAAALGTGMRDGIRAAFEEANAKGGVHGRLLALDSYDDGYQPDRAVRHTEAVIAEDAHIALIGPVGTPTAMAAQPLATAAGIPFIGAFTGAGFLRDAGLANVLNVRATYDAETEAWIAHLVDGLGLKRIALLYQDDGFGRVGLAGVTAALERRGMSLAAAGRYTRNTTAVKVALLDIREARPEAVVMVGAYAPVAEFIRVARGLAFDPVFVNISFVGSSALAAELGEHGTGVIVSQVVPFPWDIGLPVVAAYQQAMRALDPEAAFDFVSLEGYIVGRVAIAALENAGPGASRTDYLEAIAGLGRLDLGGFVLSYGPGDNQGSDAVYLTRIAPGGQFESVASGS